MPDKPDTTTTQPQHSKPPSSEEQAQTKGDDVALKAMMSATRAARATEELAGVCFDMGAALRKKVQAIKSEDLRADILAAHEFNEGARVFKSLLPVVDRAHLRYLKYNPDVGAAEEEEAE